MPRPVCLLFALFVLPVALTAATGFSGVSTGKKTYNLNNQVGANSLDFISEAPLENIKGTANGITGTFILDPSNLEATTGTITVQVRSMKTDIAKRDGHMYSSTWLDADKFPTIVYEVKGLKGLSVTSSGGKHVAKGQAVGTFTCHGVSQPLTANVEISFLPESEETKKRASGNLAMITATFNVALADFKIKGKEGLVGSNVGEVIKIRATLFANSQ